MASVNDYLKKLLYQYDCVVVPELGAFLTHYQSAAFTETSGLYLPPRKRVAFNEALRFDDGILANYIMLHEPVTREGAQKHISLFVSEVREQVTASGWFELDGIGTFTTNEESRLQFAPSLRHNFFGEAYGMDVLSVQLAKQQSLPEAALEAVPLTALGPVLVREEDTTLTPYRPARTYWRAAAIALLVGSLGAISYFSVIQPGQPFQSSLAPADLLRVPASFFEQSANPNVAPKSVSTIKRVLMSAEQTTLATSPAVEPAISVPSPTLAEVATEPAASKVKLEAKPTAKPTLVPEKIVASAGSPVRTGPHFTVIAGVFSSKRNALKLKRQLRKAGYEDAFVIMPGRGQKGFYKVAATGSAVREEAVAKMTAINELAGSESWILKN